MKRTETAGNPFSRDAASRSKLKDPKFQTFTKITQLQDEETMLAKRLDMLREKQSHLDEEITTKEKAIKKKREAIIEQKRSEGVSKEEEALRKETKELQKKLDSMSQKDTEYAELRKRLKQNIDALREDKLRMKGAKSQEEDAVKREVRYLEAKLENLRQKDNEFIALRKKLKQSIDTMRYDKIRYQEILANLRIELQQQKASQENAEQAQSKAFQRLQMEMKTLIETKKSSVMEQKRFGKEFQTVYKFFGEENQIERLNQKFPQKSIRPKEGDRQTTDYKKQNNSFDDDDSPTAPRDKKKKDRKRPEPNFNEKNLNDLKQDVERYDGTFKQLMEETKTTQMAEILQMFTNNEEDNYAIFKYINELSDDLDHLQSVKRKLQEDLKELESRPEKLKLDPKVKKQDELVKDIEAMKNRQKKQQQKYEDLRRILLSLKVSIPIMFERIGCQQEEYMTMLGEGFSFKDIDEDGIIKLLGVIERRTNDILQMQNDAQDTRHGLLSQPQQMNLLEPKNARVEESNVSVNNQQTTKELDEQLAKVADDKTQDNKILMSAKDLRDQAEKEWKKQAGRKNKKQ